MEKASYGAFGEKFDWGRTRGRWSRRGWPLACFGKAQNQKKIISGIAYVFFYLIINQYPKGFEASTSLEG